MQTVLKVTQGIYTPQQLEDCKPDLRIAHVDELPNLLTDLTATAASTNR